MINLIHGPWTLLELSLDNIMASKREDQEGDVVDLTPIKRQVDGKNEVMHVPSLPSYPLTGKEGER